GERLRDRSKREHRLGRCEPLLVNVCVPESFFPQDAIALRHGDGNRRDLQPIENTRDRIADSGELIWAGSGALSVGASARDKCERDGKSSIERRHVRQYTTPRRSVYIQA